MTRLCSLQVQFHHFEEESRPSRFPSSISRFLTSRSRGVTAEPAVPSVSLASHRRITQTRHTNHPRCWSVAIKILSFLIVFGVGWIFGFLVRWGVHKYYIDPHGHCVTPVPYQWVYFSHRRLNYFGLLLCLFRSFLTNFTNFYNKMWKKCPGIWTCDLLNASLLQ